MILGNIEPQLLMQIFRGITLILVYLVITIFYSRISKVIKEEKRIKKNLKKRINKIGYL